MSTDILLFGVGILLTVGTGFFVASEFALVNLDRPELEARQARGETRLGMTIAALKITSTHLSSAQLGITLTTLLTGYTLEPVVSRWLAGPLTSLGIPEGADAQGALRQRIVVNEWLFWQMGGLGPMTGQHGHFHVYAPVDIAYAKARYRKESERLLGVLDTRLEGRDFIAGDDYSIADMACYPWVSPYDKAPLDLSPFANVRRWQAAIRERPATQRAYALSKQVNPDAGKALSDDEKKILFGQGARR